MQKLKEVYMTMNYSWRECRVDTLYRYLIRCAVCNYRSITLNPVLMHV